MRDAFLGIRRFDDFQRDLGISRNILSDRLATLVEHGIFERRRYQEHPERFEYRLTEKGVDLYPVIVSLLAWGDKWESPDGPPLRLEHTTCGHDSEAVLACSHCHEPLDPREVRPRRGPGRDQGAIRHNLLSRCLPASRLRDATERIVGESDRGLVVTDEGLAPDGLHLVQHQLRHRGAPRRPAVRADPGRQGPPAVAGLHVREGAPPRPLPERRPPADQPDAAPAGRHVRGDRLGHGDRRGGRRLRRPCARPTAASRSSTTAAAARGTTWAAPTAAATRKALGSVYSSNALAQEKTGEFWVDGQLFGRTSCHTTGDFEHAEVAVFLGKNPWQSHGFPRARTVLKAIANDPDRSLIVIDPRRTETADLADFHLQVRPGADAWCLAALLGDPRAGGPRRPRLPRRARRRRRRRCSPSLAEVDIADACARAGLRRGRRAGRGPAHRPGRRACRSSRTSASSRRRTAR